MTTAPVVTQSSSALADAAAQVISLAREQRSLYMDKPTGKTWYEVLMQKEDPKPGEGGSGQGVNVGLRPLPFNMEAIAQFQNTNEHHSACINAKVSATVGLGFVLDAKAKKSTPAAPGTTPVGAETPSASERLTSKVDEVLNPLCEISFHDVIVPAAEDFYQVGNGYIEVVRDDGGTITGLHYLRAPQVQIYIENDLYDYHYVVSSESGAERHFAKFGDRDAFLARWGKEGSAGFGSGTADKSTVSEVIHFRQPTSLDRFYGYPKWLAAVACIELVQCLHQYKYDFFLNRGVPEFMLFVLGQKMSKEDWAKIEAALKANIGLGNSHKSVAVNLDNPEIKVQLEKLAMEAIGEDNFANTKENLALSIVSAHQTPPLLAGIQIPGKLGATNELPNALRLFQALVCGPNQRLFQQTLGGTLGNKETSGGLGLQLSDFEFYTILDEVDIVTMDTSAQMRQTEPEAKAAGRDMGKGVKS